jgi:hypothetical protein
LVGTAEAVGDMVRVRKESTSAQTKQVRNLAFIVKPPLKMICEPFRDNLRPWHCHTALL